MMAPTEDYRIREGVIHRSTWKVDSQKSISTIILHSLPLWERRMGYFPTLELIAKTRYGSSE
jgi:hypothetical protein